MIRRREVGCCTAWTKGGQIIAFRIEEHGELLSAWRRGAAFFDGHEVNGAPTTIKLGDVIVVRLLSPAYLQADREEDAADAADDRKSDMLTGEV